MLTARSGFRLSLMGLQAFRQPCGLHRFLIKQPRPHPASDGDARHVAIAV